MSESQTRNAIIATIAAAVLWSTAGLFIKLLTLNAFTILFYRSLFSALFFLVLFRKKLFVFNKTMWVSVAFYAPLLISFVTSTKLTTAANAIFLQYTSPAMVLVLEPLILKTRLTKLKALTVLFCFSGMALFFMDDFTAPENMAGIVIALLGGVAMTGLVLSQKMNAPQFHTAAVFWGNLLVCAITLPWFISEPIPDVHQLSYLIYLGMGQLGLGYILFLYGQRYLSAVESSILAMLEPILNPIWVMLGYGEIPSYFAIAGGIIIISAITFRMVAAYVSRLYLSRE